MGATEILNIEVAEGCRVGYIPAFFERHEADEMLRAFLMMDMAPEIIHMFGANTTTGRRTARYGAEYAYIAAAKRPEEWTPLMRHIRERAECCVGPLDAALVQLYPDGSAGIGWHRDKGRPEVIASVSLGAEREFVFGVASARACRETWRMCLAHGSLLLIPSETNEALKHRLPPAKRVESPRVNITLRRFPHGRDVR
jgi:alkylated DNA repair dioxygenase AlkB